MVEVLYVCDSCWRHRIQELTQGQKVELKHAEIISTVKERNQGVNDLRLSVK